MPSHRKFPAILCEGCNKTTTQLDRRPLRTIEDQFLRSDYVLSDTELNQMQQVLLEEKADRQKYDEDIAHLQRVIKDMKRGKRLLEEHMKRRRATFSVIRRVPVEIWDIIFTEICSSTDSGFALNIDLTKYPRMMEATPMVLAHVCSRWREIAIGRPRLWTSISVHFSKLSWGAGYILDMFLRNSKGYCLDVRITRRRHYRVYPLRQKDHAFWDILTPHSWRFRALYLSMDDLGPLTWSPGPLQGFQNLESYEGAVPSHVHLGEWQHGIRSAPRLTRATFYSFHHPTIIPYPQLTSIDCSFGTAKDLELLFSDGLKYCSQLQELAFRLDQRMQTVFAPILTSVNVPKLRSLVVNGLTMANPSLARMFTALTAPLLRNLHFKTTKGNTQWPTSLLEFLGRCPLLEQLEMSLRLCGDFPQSQTFFALLQQTTKLRKFELTLEKDLDLYHAPAYRSSVDNQLYWFFYTLRQPDLRSTFLPKLNSVAIYTSHATLDEAHVSNVMNALLERSAPSDDEHVAQLSELRFIRFPVTPSCACHTKTVLEPQERFVMYQEWLQVVPQGVRVEIGDIDESPPGF